MREVSPVTLPVTHLIILFLEELYCVVRLFVLRWGCKGSDLLIHHQTFMQFFIFNYLNAKDLSMRKVSHNFLIINPLFLQRTHDFSRRMAKI